MVASPNAGTVLADREHLSDLLDRITDLAQFVPDNGVTETIGLVLAVLKQLAVGAVGGLDGIMAMNPSEDYLEELNGRPAPDAVAPRRRGRLRAAARGAARARRPRRRDRPGVQGGRQRPRRARPAAAGTSTAPPASRSTSGWSSTSPRSVDHNSFFRQPEVSERLLEWLPTDLAERSTAYLSTFPELGVAPAGRHVRIPRPTGKLPASPRSRWRRGGPSRGRPGGTRGSRRGPCAFFSLPDGLGGGEVGLDLGDGVLELGDHVVGAGGLLGVGALPAAPPRPSGWPAPPCGSGPRGPSSARAAPCRRRPSARRCRGTRPWRRRGR